MDSGEQFTVGSRHNIVDRKILNVVLVLLGIFLVFLVAAKAMDLKNAGSGSESRVIAISEKGEVFAKPDLAIVVLGVRTESRVIADSLAQNAEKMNKVVEFAKSKGVEDKDIKTMDFSIYPRYEYRYSPVSIYPEGQQVLAGYVVSQSVEVKLRDMAKIGEVLEGSVAAGANETGNLRFAIDKEDDLKEQARKIAIEKAKEKAKNLSEELGVKLGKIQSFQENVNWPVFAQYDLSKEAMGRGAAAAPQIQTGENKIEVNVTLNYKIK